MNGAKNNDIRNKSEMILDCWMSEISSNVSPKNQSCHMILLWGLIQKPSNYCSASYFPARHCQTGHCQTGPLSRTGGNQHGCISRIGLDNQTKQISGAGNHRAI
jgi:hypothetical protein